MTTRSRFRGAVAAVLVLAAACSVSHSGSREAPSLDSRVRGARGMWAAPISGTRLAVAVVADGDQVMAYACDNGKTSAWFSGRAGNGALVLRSRGGATLAVTLRSGARGSLTLPGHPAAPFQLAATSRASLFRADGGDAIRGVLVGWVKLPDGSTRGSVQSGQRSGGLGSVSPAPDLAGTVAVTVPDLPTLNLGPEAMTPDVLGTAVANPPLPFSWVGMGDSFASGEGNPLHGINDRTNSTNFAGLVWGSDPATFVPFKNATNQAADVATCHRSDRAGSPQANKQRTAIYPDVQFRFAIVACGGATTKDLTTDGYTGPDTTDASRGSVPRVAQPAQIDRAKAFAGTGALDALYMNIGGNDAGFGDLISACLTPLADCFPDWSGPGGILDQRTSRLPGAYDSIAAKLTSTFGSQMPAVLMSMYPNPVDDGSVNAGLKNPVCFGADYDAGGGTGIGKPDDILKNNIDGREADFVWGVAASLNNQVEAAVIAHHWTLVNGHVTASKGHGICASDPWFNLNSAALRTQGRDNPTPIPFSDGMLHPNDKGFTAYADAIVAKMRAVVDAKLLANLQPPTNVRIGAAQDGGPITVRWNDRASAENAFEVEVIPVDSQAVAGMTYPAGVTRIAGGGYIQRLAGSNLQEYLHDARKGMYRYLVRACNTHISTLVPQPIPSCGAFSAPALGVNFHPATPTGVAFTTGTLRVTIAGRVVAEPTTTLNWASQTDAIEYVVRTSPLAGTTGTSSDTRVTGTSLDLGVTVGAHDQRFQVAACNRVGCSLFTPATSP